MQPEFFNAADYVAIDPLATAVPVMLLVFMGLWVSNSRLSVTLKRLFYAALLLRLVGTLGRYYMVTVLYDNTGDSFQYFEWGLRYNEYIWTLDFEPMMDPSRWSGQKWWGTQFVRFLTGFLVAFGGESFIGAFLFYSLIAFIGLIGFVMAFRNAYPEVEVSKYARWVWLFPSLWFWPSAIGKEAVILMGLGLAAWGFSGRGGRVNWLLLCLGILVVFAVRVQVAAVLVLALILAHWLSLSGRWTVGRIAQGVGIVAIGLMTMQLAMQQMGIDSLDVEGVQTYFEQNTGRGGSDGDPTRRGAGSAVDGAAIGLGGVPVAVANILFRPFPWEARNAQLLITSFEIMAMWAIVWARRHSFLPALRHWRSDRLLRLAVPFILVYSVSIGMLLANMGLIARQRILLFPFFFILVEAVPRAATAMKRQAQEIRERHPGHMGRPFLPSPVARK